MARAFDLLADLLELHGENEFKVKSYRNAYLILRKLERPVSELTEAELKSLKGIGPAISAKIVEMANTGTMQALEKVREITPPGVVELMQINGLGARKVQAIWKEMGIESVGELWYACHENRLVEYKGFGLKTQRDIQEKLNYYLRSKDKMHLPTADAQAAALIELFAGHRMEAVGDIRRRCPVVERVELLTDAGALLPQVIQKAGGTALETQPNTWEVNLPDQSTAWVHTCAPEAFGAALLQRTGTQVFVESLPSVNTVLGKNEEEIFTQIKFPYVFSEIREKAWPDIAGRVAGKPLIQTADLQGVLHVHTTWSDGLHSLRDMCLYAKSLGYQYIGITDHSKSAFYANGLSAERVLEQMAEIEALNAELAPFRVLKGIESDILPDGSLDYDDALLAKFDFVIASVHSHLNMTEEKATARILRALSHPSTTILGHPTSRLLLTRAGYPLDWPRIFEACAHYGVAIELNAHPYRLDIDYTLIPEARAHGIPISINPDAHSREGIHDVQYGLSTARKGWLTAEGCFNTWPLEALLAWKKKKQ